MTSDLAVFLVAECLRRAEPCVPDLTGEPWFSIAFVAAVLGYDDGEYFRKRINRANVPRHPFRNDCIRFSDLALIGDQTQ